MGLCPAWLCQPVQSSRRARRSGQDRPLWQGFCANDPAMPTLRPHDDATPLSEREREILRLVVQSFVQTAGPVGSRTLVKRYGLDLSPASIRNTMSDLEDAGYLEHPYTSAGRVPTARGYRTFVDELMQTPRLSSSDKAMLRAALDQLVGNRDELLRETSKVLGRLSNLLGVVLAPNMATGVLERIEAVPLSSTRLMFVLSLRGGLVRTIVLEMDLVLGRNEVERVVEMLNERLAGLPMEEVRASFAQRVRDLDYDDNALVRLILNRTDTFFADADETRLRLSPTSPLLEQPEFQHPDELRNLIGVLEDERFLVQLLEDRPDGEEMPRALVTIGPEHADGKTRRYSLVTARYRLGSSVGTIGVLGPLRMDYARVVTVVEHVAQLLSREDPSA